MRVPGCCHSCKYILDETHELSYNFKTYVSLDLGRECPTLYKLSRSHCTLILSFIVPITHWYPSCFTEIECTVSDHTSKASAG